MGCWLAKKREAAESGMAEARLIAIYWDAIQPMETFRGIASDRATGLAASDWQPISLWRSMRPLSFSLRKTEGVVGGGPGGAPSDEEDHYRWHCGILQGSPPPPWPSSEDRKTIRTGLMDLVVKSPRDTSDRIRQLAERTGGFLVSSEIYEAENASSASVQIRAPTNKFEEVRGEIRNRSGDRERKARSPGRHQAICGPGRRSTQSARARGAVPRDS